MLFDGEGTGTPLQYSCLENPWTEEPGRLQSMGSLRVGHDWETSLSLFTFHFHSLEKEMATHSSVLAWRIPGTGEPGGLPSMGLHRVGQDWSDLAAAAAAYWLVGSLPLAPPGKPLEGQRSIIYNAHWPTLFSPKGRAMENQNNMSFINLPATQ